jgi:hypothetical protein
MEEQYVKKRSLLEIEGPSQTLRTALSECVLSSLATWFSHRNQGFTQVHLLYVHEPWIPDALQA